MGIANLYIELTLGDRPPTELPVILEPLCDGLLRPMSVSFWNWEGERVVVPRSLPTDPYNPPLLKGEHRTPGCSLTRIGVPHPHLDWMADRDEVHSRWSAWVESLGGAPEIWFQAWGPVLVYPESGTCGGQDWYLIDEIQFINRNVRIPLLKLQVGFRTGGGTFLSIHSSSRVWSAYALVADSEDVWARKDEDRLGIARRNVQRLVERVARVRAYAGDLEWSVNSDGHQPDPTELVEHEMRVRLGEP